MCVCVCVCVYFAAGDLACPVSIVFQVYAVYVLWMCVCVRVHACACVCVCTCVYVPAGDEGLPNNLRLNLLALVYIHRS